MSTIDERIELLRGDPTWINNWSLGGLAYHGEISDSATRGVWLTKDPITPEEYEALVLPEGYRKSGVGLSQHDAAFFLRPPGALVDGPVETVEIGGHSFGLVARGGKPEAGFDGAIVLPVYKSHRVLFAAGRTLEIIDIGHGWCLMPQVVDASLGRRDPGTPATPRTMPEGWTSRHMTIETDLVIDIPYPARVAIFFNGDIFHGPVRLDLP